VLDDQLPTDVVMQELSTLARKDGIKRPGYRCADHGHHWAGGWHDRIVGPCVSGWSGLARPARRLVAMLDAYRSAVMADLTKRLAVDRRDELAISPGALMSFLDKFAGNESVLSFVRLGTAVTDASEEYRRYCHAPPMMAFSASSVSI